MGRVCAQWTSLSASELAKTPREREDAERFAFMGGPGGEESLPFLTTARVSRGEILFCEGHIARLRKAWEYAFPQEAFPSELFTSLFQWIPEKLTHYWGESPLLFRCQWDGRSWELSSGVLQESKEEAISLVIYRDPNWRASFPSFFKTPVPREVVDLKKELSFELGKDADLLVCDGRDQIIESSIWSLILADGKRFVFPSHPSALESVSQEKLFSRMRQKFKCSKEKAFSLEDLKEVKSAWLTNSVRGVRAIEGIYEITRREERLDVVKWLSFDNPNDELQRELFEIGE